ncbi:hypothetical protein OHA72_43720 [Dactylosporangium sp. NBC_01737]|uniref:hypothetical protein n=1 Tax=Dactylosporangium sp. NBC_01737 TaxID=2975959 RepID=UPI002E10AC31|nr:hypothetical protein OHA72_43720 [Dactylosporangium sp. NBC_01737]
MSDAYTVFWPQDRCLAARAAVMAGRPLEVLFGGPHLSLPSFARAKVTAGDLVYPIGVFAQRLYVLGRMRVTAVRDVEDGETDRFPHWRFLADGCVSETVLGEAGTLLRQDATVPAEAVRRLTYRSLRATRTLKHVDDDGLLTRSLGVQGIYRLAEHSALDLDAALDAPADPTAPAFGPPVRSRPTPPPAQVEVLF